MRKRNLTETKVEKAIIGSGGIISNVAKRCNSSWWPMRDFINKSPKLQALLDAEREVILDLAENQLFKAIEQGSIWAIKFFLSTKGKDRGYTPLPEFHQENTQVNIIVKEVDFDDAKQLTHD